MYSRFKEHSYCISVCNCESILVRNINVSIKRGKLHRGSVVINISSDKNDEMRQTLFKAGWTMSLLQQLGVISLMS